MKGERAPAARRAPPACPQQPRARPRPVRCGGAKLPSVYSRSDVPLEIFTAGFPGQIAGGSHVDLGELAAGAAPALPIALAAPRSAYPLSNSNRPAEHHQSNANANRLENCRAHVRVHACGSYRARGPHLRVRSPALPRALGAHPDGTFAGSCGVGGGGGGGSAHPRWVPPPWLPTGASPPSRRTRRR
jgi:hypothetical protein